MLAPRHPSFFPPDRNCTLWRYLDLTKLLSLLETRTLHFTRVDHFGDPWEGMPSPEAVRQFRVRNDHVPPGLLEGAIQTLGEMRREFFVSCWCSSEHESAAMWKLYLQSAEGVAIQTDHDRLLGVLEPSQLRIRTTCVQYVNYETTPIPANNSSFDFVTFKRLSFSHERELRAVIWAVEDLNRPQIQNDALHVNVELEPNDLIQAVHVCPTAPSWFGELVQALMARYGLRCPVVKSSLYDRPTY